MMKKGWFIGLLILSLSWSTQAQQQFMVSLTERAFHVVPTTNQGFYTLTHQVNCPDDHIVVRYFNRQGVLQAESRSPVYLGNISSIAAVCIDNAHMLMYLCDGTINHLLFEFDTTATQVWNRNFQITQSPAVAYKKILPIPGGGFYLLGNQSIFTINDSAKSVLTRCAANGQLLWSKQYSMADWAPSYVKFNDVQWHQGQLLAAGYHYRSGNVVGWAPKRPTWLKMDTAGNPLQAMYYMVDSGMIGFDEYEFMRLEPTPAGHYQALVYNSGNEHALIRLDNQLNIRWIKEKLAGRVQAFAVGYHDEVFVVPDGQSANMILGLDSNGAFLSARKTPYSPNFNDNSKYGTVCTIQPYDCGFLVANDKTMIAHTRQTMAYCSDSTFTYNPSYYAVNTHTRKTVQIAAQPIGPFNMYLSASTYTPQNSSPQTWCSSAYTCVQPNGINNPLASPEGIRVYPSLYHQTFYVETPSTESWHLILCDAMGKKVLEQELKGQTKYEIRGLDGAVGQYFLRLQQGEQVFRTRLEQLR